MGYLTKTTDRARNEKKQLQSNKGKKKLTPVSKAKYKTMFMNEY